MGTSIPNRQPGGIPVGGQFASKATAEASIDLTDSVAAGSASGPVTVGQAVALSRIADAAIHGWRVARLVDGDQLVVGTARSIADEHGYLAGSDDDIRDCHLRVTTDAGLEAFWKVSGLVEEMERGEFSYDYEPHRRQLGDEAEIKVRALQNGLIVKAARRWSQAQATGLGRSRQEVEARAQVNVFGEVAADVLKVAMAPAGFTMGIVEAVRELPEPRNRTGSREVAAEARVRWEAGIVEEVRRLIPGASP